MFALANLFYLVVVAVAPISLYSTADHPFPQLTNQMINIEYQREWWRSEGDCTFTALVTPYIKDWDDVGTNEDGKETYRTAATQRIEGVAVLVYKKTCPGKPVEAILRADTITTRRLDGTLYRKHHLIADDMVTAPEENRPEWFKQIMDRITEAAPTNPVAKDFTESMAELAKATQAAQAAQAAKEAQAKDAQAASAPANVSASAPAAASAADSAQQQQIATSEAAVAHVESN